MQGRAEAGGVLELAVEGEGGLEGLDRGAEVALAQRDRAQPMPAQRLAGDVVQFLGQAQGLQEAEPRRLQVVGLPGVDGPLLQRIEAAVFFSPRHHGLTLGVTQRV